MKTGTYDRHHVLISIQTTYGRKIIITSYGRSPVLRAYGASSTPPVASFFSFSLDQHYQ
jgi:hypothetical protein